MKVVYERAAYEESAQCISDMGSIVGFFKDGGIDPGRLAMVRDRMHLPDTGPMRELRPELASFWDAGKNGPLGDITPLSRKTVGWTCARCGGGFEAPVCSVAEYDRVYWASIGIAMCPDCAVEIHCDIPWLWLDRDRMPQGWGVLEALVAARSTVDLKRGWNRPHEGAAHEKVASVFGDITGLDPGTCLDWRCLNCGGFVLSAPAAEIGPIMEEHGLRCRECHISADRGDGDGNVPPLVSDRKFAERVSRLRNLRGVVRISDGRVFETPAAASRECGVAEGEIRSECGAEAGAWRRATWKEMVLASV